MHVGTTFIVIGKVVYEDLISGSSHFYNSLTVVLDCSPATQMTLPTFCVVFYIFQNPGKVSRLRERMKKYAESKHHN